MNHTKNGYLFVFEGPDGVGKTSLVKYISRILNTNNINPLCISFPGKEQCGLGKLVYKLHHNSKRFGIDKIDPYALQTLHIAAHIDIIKNTIIPELRKGRVILLDRYWWSTVVYGRLSGIENTFLNNLIKIEKISWETFKPSMIFLIKRSLEVIIPSNDKHINHLVREYDQLVIDKNAFGEIIIVNNNKRLKETALSITQKIIEVLNKEKKIFEDIKSTNKIIYTKQKLKSNKALTYSKLSVPIPTVVYNTYWRFAAERQKIYYRRIFSDPPPWTEDKILCNHKFTNAYRASDRVSQYLIKNVIYDSTREPKDALFRILLFKTFNKIETWEMLEKEFGQVSTNTYSFDKYDQALFKILGTGNRIYSGAYIMASGKQFFGYDRKHSNHLKMIESIIANRLYDKISMMSNMEELYKELLKYPTIGSFLAYQYAIDINYSELTSFDEGDFVVAGPGARDGIRKCFHNLGGLSENDIIKYVTERQDQEFERLGLEFKSLWGRPLKLIDCQNLFCEVDKYARLAHPDIDGISGRKRIKQKFIPKTKSFYPWYPPKWKLNEKISSDMRNKCF